MNGPLSRPRVGIIATVVLAVALLGGTPAVASAGASSVTPQSTASAAECGDGASCALPDVPSAPPRISGTAAVGSFLTADVTGWESGTRFGYRWFADSAVIPSATGRTLTLTSKQAGKRITVEVSGERDGFAPVTRRSAATTRVLLAGTPSISGTAVVGSTLTAKPGTWTKGVRHTYRWFADGVAVGGAKGSMLKLASGVGGKRITVSVTGTLSGYATVTSGSKATVRVLATAKPKVSGTVAIGSTLTAKPGAWTKGTAFSYQWYANGKAISGAKKSTLKLTSGLKGKKISVKVTGAQSGHAKAAVASARTARVATATTPKISGVAAVGSKLTIKRGTWTSGTAFTYRWHANGKPIPGATKPTFTVTASQLGKALTVTVTGKKSGYATVAKTSGQTKKVPRTSKPSISGTAQLNATLTVRTGTWSKGTAFSYQWYANGKAISGAKKSTLKLTSGLKGKRISVAVTGKAAGFTTVKKTSASTKAVAYPSRTRPSGLWTCPSWAPIKGNADSMIYHTPSSRWYSRTIPEECFRTAAAAEKAGYRAPLR